MDEQREDIIKDNNTAQDQLLSVLENLTKSAKEIKIDEALFGDIDFSILNNYVSSYGMTFECFLDVRERKSSLIQMRKGK